MKKKAVIFETNIIKKYNVNIVFKIKYLVLMQEIIKIKSNMRFDMI